MHEFTDGCSAQYKSRHCIGDISYGCSDLGYDKIVRNFFETSHAAGGFIKKQADLSIIRGQRVIQSARDLYVFASENLCKTAEDSKCSRRIFRYIDTINRNRDRYFKPVKENRKIHQESEDEEIADEIEQLYELVSTGTIFAVKADDVNQLYYLVKANKQMTVLRKESTDKWGITYLPGTKVIHGYYFGMVNDNPLEQKLIKRIPAVPALSVVYVCSELEISGDGTIHIDNSLHRSILRCLDE
ncbi:unnamed protein product [Mytilus coruscus]|uniref:Uncharacterized protein n=1 Tax=Mytilus coruscus TaxID=42192 RepID=A0A6J8DTL4_MYTCO|nr:unnamed protein product [Mytilus coruscus]